MLQKGDTLGNWTVIDTLGRGGTAQVWLVQHMHLGTRCALKQPLSLSGRARERLLREARIQAELRHSNLVRVHDVLETADGDLCLVMDFIQGRTLADALRLGPIPRVVAIQIFRDIVAGVIAAHDANIVHRDLKPANVLLCGPASHPDVRVTDFGLGKHLEGDKALTTSRGLLGTIQYMAPEQAQSASTVGIRADIYSLGCILYELLTSRRVFPGEDVVELVRRAQNGIWERFDAPSEIKMALEGCLAPNPTRRIPNGRTLLAVLDGRGSWNASSLRLVRPQRDSQLFTRWAIPGLALMLIIVTGTVVILRLNKDTIASTTTSSEASASDPPAPAPLAPPVGGNDSQHRDSQTHWIVAPSSSPFPGTVYWMPSISESVQCAYDLVGAISTSAASYEAEYNKFPATLSDAGWRSGTDKCSHIVTARYPAEDEGKRTVALVTAGCARGSRYGADPGGHIVALPRLSEDEIAAWFRKPDVYREAGSLGQLDTWRYAIAALRCDPEEIPKVDEVSFGVACALDMLRDAHEAEVVYESKYDNYQSDLSTVGYVPPQACTESAQVTAGLSTSSNLVLEATVCSKPDRGRRFQERNTVTAPVEVAGLSGDAPDLCPPSAPATPSQTSPPSP